MLNALPEVLENAFLHRQEPNKHGRNHINGFHGLFAPVVLKNRVYLGACAVESWEPLPLRFMKENILFSVNFRTWERSEMRNRGG